MERGGEATAGTEVGVNVCHAAPANHGDIAPCGANLRPVRPQTHTRGIVTSAHFHSFSTSLRFINCAMCLAWMKKTGARTVDSDGQKGWGW